MTNYSNLVDHAKRLALLLNGITPDFIDGSSPTPDEVYEEHLTEVVAHFNNRVLAMHQFWNDLKFQPVTALSYEDPLPEWKQGRAIIEFSTQGLGHKYRMDIGESAKGLFHVYEFKVSKMELVPSESDVVLHMVNREAGFSLKFTPRNAGGFARENLSELISTQARSSGRTKYDESSADMFDLLQFTLRHH